MEEVDTMDKDKEPETSPRDDEPETPKAPELATKEPTKTVDDEDVQVTGVGKAPSTDPASTVAKATTSSKAEDIKPPPTTSARGGSFADATPALEAMDLENLYTTYQNFQANNQHAAQAMLRMLKVKYEVTPSSPQASSFFRKLGAVIFLYISSKLQLQ